MIIDGPNWPQLEFAAKTTPEKIRLAMIRGIKSYDEFSDLVEMALNYSIGELVKSKNIINPAGTTKSRMDEDQITLMISNPLKAMCFDISHSKNVGGNCDVLIEGYLEMMWIGEAKIYTDYTKLMGGFQQLCDRYSTGMPNQNRGGMLIYFFGGQISDVMQNWRSYLVDAREKLVADDLAAPFQHLRTREPHGATSIDLNILHFAVPLMHEPTDVDAKPKRKVA